MFFVNVILSVAHPTARLKNQFESFESDIDLKGVPYGKKSEVPKEVHTRPLGLVQSLSGTSCKKKSIESP